MFAISDKKSVSKILDAVQFPSDPFPHATLLGRWDSNDHCKQEWLDSVQPREHGTSIAAELALESKAYCARPVYPLYPRPRLIRSILYILTIQYGWTIDAVEYPVEDDCMIGYVDMWLKTNDYYIILELKCRRYVEASRMVSYSQAMQTMMYQYLARDCLPEHRVGLLLTMNVCIETGEISLYQIPYNEDMVIDCIKAAMSCNDSVPLVESDLHNEPALPC